MKRAYFGLLCLLCLLSVAISGQAAADDTPQTETEQQLSTEDRKILEMLDLLEMLELLDHMEDIAALEENR